MYIISPKEKIHVWLSQRSVIVILVKQNLVISILFWIIIFPLCFFFSYSLIDMFQHSTVPASNCLYIMVIISVSHDNNSCLNRLARSWQLMWSQYLCNCRSLTWEASSRDHLICTSHWDLTIYRFRFRNTLMCVHASFVCAHIIKFKMKKIEW